MHEENMRPGIFLNLGTRPQGENWIIYIVESKTEEESYKVIDFNFKKITYFSWYTDLKNVEELGPSESLYQKAFLIIFGD